MSELNNFVADFLVAGISAAAAKTAVAPFEKIRLMFYSQDELIKQGRLEKPYTGIIDAASKLVKLEGIKWFWRANIPNTLKYFPIMSLNFAFNEQCRRMFDIPKSASYWKQFSANIISGGIAGVSSLVIMYPTHPPYGYKDGFAGRYRGFLPSAFGIAIYRGIYFGVYNSIKPIILQGELKNSFFASFPLAWGTTIGASLASYPIDVVRRRMLTDRSRGTYASNIDCAKQLLKKEGVSTFYRYVIQLLR